MQQIREDIENIVGSVCDGTYPGGLEDAYFVEFGSKTPQDLANELVSYVERLLTQRTSDGECMCVEQSGRLVNGKMLCWLCNLPLRRR